MKPLITLTSDFGVQSQGIGIMEAVALQINPDAQIIHLMHGLPDFDLLYAARTMETINYVPVGYHVCVVDPGVGTKRKPIIIKAGRGDYLIGPDNGVLIPATRFLGGIKKSVEMEEFGKELNPKELAKAPYEEAEAKGNEIHATVISTNKFGSLHLNVMHEVWDNFNVKFGNLVEISLKKKKIKMPFFETFGQVDKGKPLIFKDDYGRVEIALNQGSFIKKYPIKIGDDAVIRKV
ncbi:SAM-dependent chlorinase/fluorinase [Candidatus Woesearchaeota archaeon]|nr:SAM-dependent chlorinase/fluorinase [Candidatus Woesearchaeota archaeon]